MNELYLWPINAGAQGTPKQVKKVIDSVEKYNIPTVFCESTVSQSPAKQISRETGAAYGGVLYVDSLTKADGPVPSYLDLFKSNVRNNIGRIKQLKLFTPFNDIHLRKQST